MSEKAALGDPLHPRIVEVLSVLDGSRAELHALLASVDSERLKEPATDELWSVAQVLEHLTMVEDGAGRLITKMTREVESSGLRETLTSSILSINDAYEIETAAIRIVAPDQLLPKAGLSPEESVLKLEEIRVRLKRALQLASGWDLGAASKPHPLFGPLTGYQWALLVGQHERRHIRQLKRILNKESAPTELSPTALP